ncbi:MAG: hypothetical protein RLZZ591_1824 [Pseudomonadota bacterium]|jgi:predicted anti-sigma-YlaC factor YlaD
MASGSSLRFLVLLLLMSSVALSACSPRHLLVKNAADALASQGQSDEEDIGLAREASAFYFKLSESLLRESPGHLKLAQSVASGLTQYAYAFVAFEAEQLGTQDAHAAHKLNERARRLYLRAHRHAMTALEQSSPGFRAALSQSDKRLWPRIDPTQLNLAYWAAASWGASIALSKDDPDAVADLPLAVRLATLAWQTAPQHAEGALASLLGSFESARPGGSRELATKYFDDAISASAGNNAGPYVAKAESIALSAGDRPQFEMLLKQALRTAEKRTDLASQVMHQRATWLLRSADDLF